MSLKDLRRIADRSRGPTAEDTIVLDARSEYEEFRDAAVSYAEKKEAFEIDPLNELIDHLESFVEFGMITEEDMQAARDAFSAIEHALGLISDDIDGVEEAYDEIESRWDDYVGIKEQDRYDGKADDVQGAWEEVGAAMHTFADLMETLGQT